MLKISVQAMSGAARFSVAVQADSIERALEIVKRQNLGRDCEVTFAIDPEAFLVAELRRDVRAGRPGEYGGVSWLVRDPSRLQWSI